MPKSVLDAIKMGDWDFEPANVAGDDYEWTDAMPGTKDKVAILAERLRSGLPLWHPMDRFAVDDPRPTCKPR